MVLQIRILIFFVFALLESCSVEDRSARYVAQENIIPVDHPNPPPGLMPWAGRYFKRWDAVRCTFVSNVRDEYPDD
jgi:F-box protein 21